MRDKLNVTGKASVWAVVATLSLPVLTPAQLAINVDVNRNIFSPTHSGTAVAPDSGTVWNPVILASSPATFSNVKDSAGNTLASDIVITAGSGSFNTWNNATAGNPNPVDLMNEYTYTGVYTVTITDLPAGDYSLYAFGQGDQDWQSGGFEIDAANGGASVAPANLVGDPDFRNLLRADALGKTYHRLDGTVDGSGTFTFRTTSDGYLNGFQLVQSSGPPVIAGLNDVTATIGSTLVLNPAVSGSSPITYQWQENGLNLAGATNASLTLTNVQASQNGFAYALDVQNSLGSDSASMTLTVVGVETNQLTINLDVNVSSGDHYSGPGAASDGGTFWNSFVPAAGSTTPAVLSNVDDSNGDPTAADITITPTAGSGFSRYSQTTLGNPNPLNLMKDYLYNNSGEYLVTLSSLDPGIYGLYVFAHGDQANQNPIVTVNAANGGGIGQQGSSGDQYRNIYTVGAEGYAYLLFTTTVGGSGQLQFTTASHLNGFQVQRYSAPSLEGVVDKTVIEGNSTSVNPVVSGIPFPAFQWRENGLDLPGETNAFLALSNVQHAQDGNVYSVVASNPAGATTNSMTLTVIVTPTITGLNNRAVAPGTEVVLAPTVAGVPAPALQWLSDGGPLVDGATGNGSTISGSTSDTLTLGNAQIADSGSYSLIASNAAGRVTNAMTLVVSSTNVPPAITGLTDQTVVQGSDALFSGSASGLPVPDLQWRLNGADIPGATGTSLTVTNIQYAQDGDVYSLVASNVAGIVTNSATLHVLVPPSITVQPSDVAVTVGGTALFSVTAGGVPAVTYQWSLDGNPIPGATNSSYAHVGVQGSDNGTVFAVEVANSVGSQVSSAVTLTVLSSMTGSFLPGNGATNIAPDQQLRIVFSSTPTIGRGRLTVRDAADDSLFATIDVSEFVTFSYDGATVTNAAVRTVQGNGCFYMPIAIYGKEAWITLNSNERFEYGHTYYVNTDAGLFRDPANASFPGISGPHTWRFSTKPVGPGTPTAGTGPINITVGLDGAGDFATLQGASDWVPPNNTLHRTITVLPGTYRDYTLFNQGRDHVTVRGAGADREDVEFFYPYPIFSNGSGAGVLHLESDDIIIRRLTLDDAVYLNYNGVQFAGRIQTLITKNADRIVFHDVLIKGGQDTYYGVSGIVYFRDCEMWGSVDFIYGAALMVFEQCRIVEIRDSGGPITAPNTDLASPYGVVFLDCEFPQASVADGYPYTVGNNTTTFQRPWRQDGHTAVINCSVGAQVSTKGWAEWGNRHTTCRAREYGTTLIGGGSVTPAQRQSAGAYWLNTIDPDYVNDPSIDPDVDPEMSLLLPPSGHLNRTNVTVNPADYTLTAIFGHPYYGLGGWLPAAAPVIAVQPLSQTVEEGADVVLSVEADGFPALTFQWKRNGAILVGATNATLNLDSVVTSDGGDYVVEISNSAGTVVSAVATLTVNVPTLPATSIPAVLGDGAVQFSFNGTSGQAYRLWGSTNLALSPVPSTWTLLTNGVFGSGSIVFTDTETGLHPQRFYIISSP